MNVVDFLAALRDRDIHLRADGDRLRCSAPAGALTPELRDALKERKAEILKFLESAGALARQQRAVVPLQPLGKRAPIFAVAGHNGDVFCFRALAKHLGDDQPFFGLQPPGLDGQSEPIERVEDLSAYFAGQIRAFHPKGPYVIAGYCAGGAIAFELGRQLLQDGAEIHVLALFGSIFPTSFRFLPQLKRRAAHEFKRAVRHSRALASFGPGLWRAYVAERLDNLRRRSPAARSNAPDPVLVRRAKVEQTTVAALRRYTPGRFPGCLSLFLPSREWVRSGRELLRWRSAAQHSKEYFGPDSCRTEIMMREPHAATFAALFRQCCDERAVEAATESNDSNYPSDPRTANAKAAIYPLAEASS